MRPRCLVVLLLAASAAAAPACAEPDRRGETPGMHGPSFVHPDIHSLDFLFGALKAAPDDEIARAIEQRIWAVWGRSSSDTTSLLMTRVQKAIEDKNTGLALELLNAVVTIKPDYVEGWNRRATLYYMKKDYGRALADIREVLKREPRHFGALSGLGLILQDIGDDKQALQVYRRLLVIYPRMQRIPDLVKELSEKVEGRDI